MGGNARERHGLFRFGAFVAPPTNIKTQNQRPHAPALNAAIR
jgi:hypothetical protein